MLVLVCAVLSLLSVCARARAATSEDVALATSQTFFPGSA